MSLPLNWTAQRGEGLIVGHKDAGLFSCGLYFEERKDAWCVSSPLPVGRPAAESLPQHKHGWREECAAGHHLPLLPASQQASGAGLFSRCLGWLIAPMAWGISPGSPHLSVTHPQWDGGVCLSPLTSGRERQSGRDPLQVLWFGAAGLTPAVHPLHAGPPPPWPTLQPPLCLRILPGRCQSPECGQRLCWWIPQMERGNRPNRPQPQAVS